MSFLYPRTVSVLRPKTLPTSAAGIQGYSGETQGGGGEDLIFSGLPANFAQARARNNTLANIPTDAPDNVSYWISIPASAGVTVDEIKTRDIIVDDLGVRYQVSSPNWNGMGFRLYSQMLQA